MTLPPELPVPPEEQPETKISLSAESSFRGPLPPPAHMAGYEDVLEGAAHRILAMAESEVGHRHRMESDTLQIQARDLRASQIRTRLGLVCGLVTVLAFCTVSLGTILAGYAWPGVAVSATTAGGIVGAFIYGSRGLNGRPPDSD